MPKSGHTEEQIVAVLRQVEAGARVDDVCRKVGISQATGSLFLTQLAKTLGRHTLQHIRSLASGIFTHAVNRGVVDTNPWHDCRVLGRTIEPGETQHYTLEEAENVISALRCCLDVQAVMALAFFVGLGPGEIQGLR